MRAENPVPPDLEKWSGSGMKLAGVHRAIFRRHGIAIIFSERDDGWWHITKIKGGRELASRLVHKLPEKQAILVEDAIRKSSGLKPTVRSVRVS